MAQKTSIISDYFRFGICVNQIPDNLDENQRFPKIITFSIESELGNLPEFLSSFVKKSEQALMINTELFQSGAAPAQPLRRGGSMCWGADPTVVKI